MRPLAKVLLTLLIGLVLVLALSSPSQTTDIDHTDCKVCHTSSAYSIHHATIFYSSMCCSMCHGPYSIPNDDCLYSGCHVAQVE